MKIFIPHAKSQITGHYELFGYFASKESAIRAIKEDIAERDDKDDIEEFPENRWGYSKSDIFYWIAEANVQP